MKIKELLKTYSENRIFIEQLKIEQQEIAEELRDVKKENAKLYRKIKGEMK